MGEGIGIVLHWLGPARARDRIGLHWFCIGLHWFCIGLHWFALVCIGLHWFVLVCICLHWICIGFAWVCIGFALVCIGFALVDAPLQVSWRRQTVQGPASQPARTTSGDGTSKRVRRHAPSTNAHAQRRGVENPTDPTDNYCSREFPLSSRHPGPQREDRVE